MYESLDIETIWKNNTAYSICIAISSNKKILYKRIEVDEIETDKIVEFMLEKCSSKKIYYVHNLTFEMIVFIKSLKRLEVKFKFISNNKSIYSAEIIYKNKKIRLRCSYKLTMMSLKDLSKVAEVEEKSIFPYKILNTELKEIMTINPSMFNNEEEYKIFKNKYGKIINTYNVLEEYCKNDVRITKESIIKYWKIIEENGLKKGSRILTAAKLSIENFFSKNFVIKKKIDIKIDRIIRKGYFGGRTEVFGNPKDEIMLHHDWSGMYAQCMCEKVLGGEIYQSDVVRNINIPGFYWIKFTQSLEFPILPIRKEKLMFANGTFEGWYWFEEILMAIEYGVKIERIEKIITCQYYEDFIKNFVEINNKIRSISELHKIIGKNNNNTFYGRLGMNPSRLEEEIVSDLDGNNGYEKIVESNGIYIGFKKKEKSVSNVLISASITAKARIKLYRGMMEVIKEGGRLLYTDTDSIIAAFDKKTYEKALNKKIGEVFFDSSKKDTIIIDAVFAMPKTYGIKYINNIEIVKIKGFNVTPKFEDFKKAFYNKSEIVTINREWSKKDFLISNISREKRTNLFSLDKRIWKKDLKETTPISI